MKVTFKGRPLIFIIIFLIDLIFGFSLILISLYQLEPNPELGLSGPGLSENGRAFFLAAGILINIWLILFMRPVCSIAVSDESVGIKGFIGRKEYQFKDFKGVDSIGLGGFRVRKKIYWTIYFSLYKEDYMKCLNLINEKITQKRVKEQV